MHKMAEVIQDTNFRVGLLFSLHMEQGNETRFFLAENPM